jgi:hypothetical protein
MLEYSVMVNETMKGRMKYVAEHVYMQLAEDWSGSPRPLTSTMGMEMGLGSTE